MVAGATLSGRWSQGDVCGPSIRVELDGDTLRLTEADGRVDTLRVLEQDAATLTAETTASDHGVSTGRAGSTRTRQTAQVSLPSRGKARTHASSNVASRPF